MLQNYFLITFRSILKNKVFILINVFGMGIAIACCIVAYFASEYNSNYDGVHVNGEKIYRVTALREFEGTLTRFGYASMPLGSIVQKSMPDVNQSTRYFYSYSNFKRDNDLFASHLHYVDPDFFRMFTFEFVAGNPSELKDRTSLFLSEEMAVKLFHSPREALGKMVTQVYGPELKELKVAGVFKDPPMNSSFYWKGGSSYLNFENSKDEHAAAREDNWKEVCTLFLQINDASRVKQVHDQLQTFVATNNQAREDFVVKEFLLEKLPGMAIKDRVEFTTAWTFVAPPQSAIIGSAVMAVLILLIACFNLTNTSIAISSRRLKEIGLRKVMGSRRQQLIFQFIGETTFICFLALIVGLAFADFLLQGWNYLWEYMQLTPHYFDSLGFLLFLVGVLLVTGILAGSYPAFYISKFEPVSILKGKLKFGGTNLFTRLLLGMQFAISLIAIVSAIGFYQNARYQSNYDLGFDVRGSVITWLNNQEEVDAYKHALQQNPQIRSIAGARSGVFSNRLQESVKHEAAQLEVDIIEVGDHYLSTMDLKLTKGRDFNQDSESDQRESIIITQKMADEFGWADPIGKEIIWRDSIHLRVIGLVKDIYTQGLWHELDPMMIKYILPKDYTQLIVNTSAAAVPAVNEYMQNEWQKLFPNRLYNGHMMVQSLNDATNVNLSVLYMYIFIGVVAMMLSVTGLFSLVSLNIIKRMKEIGVRKVLGASVANIAMVINVEFFLILVIASAAGSWASYSLCNMLMNTIWRYYQGVGVMTFVVSVILLFMISFAVVGYKILSVATMNPVKSLKDE
jgi:ABC-type antimicrobial peptide transport system permease subunit